MGVSDGIEGDLMDEEARRALELSEEDLNARFEAGSHSPRVAKRPPLRVRRKQQHAAAIVAEVTERTESVTVSFPPDWRSDSIVIMGSRIRQEGPVEFPTDSPLTVEP